MFIYVFDDTFEEHAIPIDIIKDIIPYSHNGSLKYPSDNVKSEIILNNNDVIATIHTVDKLKRFIIESKKILSFNI